MPLGDFLVAYLRKIGVTHLFGIPGDLVLRLFHSGTGTFWTNMNSKGLNFLMPISGGEAAKGSAGPGKKETPTSEGK